MKVVERFRVRYRTLVITAVVLWLILLVLIANYGWARIAAVRRGLQNEMVMVIDDVLLGVEQNQMYKAEQAAMRFWRLAQLYELLPLSGQRGRLVGLADDLSDIAAGWCALPLTATGRDAVRLQLLNLREMIALMELTHADSIVVWLRTR